MSRLLRLNVDLKSFLNPHILLIWLLLTLSVSKTEIPSCGAQYGSNEGVIEAINEFLGNKKRPSILKGIERSNRDGISALL